MKLAALFSGSYFDIWKRNPETIGHCVPDSAIKAFEGEIKPVNYLPLSSVKESLDAKLKSLEDSPNIIKSASELRDGVDTSLRDSVEALKRSTNIYRMSIDVSPGPVGKYIVTGVTCKSCGVKAKVNVHSDNFDDGVELCISKALVNLKHTSDCIVLEINQL